MARSARLTKFAKFTKFTWAAAVLALIATTAAQAEGPAPKSATPASMTAISPIFGQLVRFSMPAGICPGVRNDQRHEFIFARRCPKGETTAAVDADDHRHRPEGACRQSQIHAARFGRLDGRRLQGACPETFVTKGFRRDETRRAGCVRRGGGMRQGRCERRRPQRDRVDRRVKGSTDAYTIQWAERAASQPPIPHRRRKWQQRLHALMPIRFCPIVAGEAAPIQAACSRNSRRVPLAGPMRYHPDVNGINPLAGRKSVFGK